MLKLRNGGGKCDTFSRVLRKEIFGHKCYEEKQTRSEETNDDNSQNVDQLA